ncbi:hypothetical protein AVEN_100732-1 [Araneus ventricosus]|uniref:Uncharacterized protein n=1 Tax=Araneus ventricosus TaxID=182803 RepID=A0A4Y2CUE3_ARAVE|nr:hypothetical protein AVEN_100732-1 [Araneus ventricosus]
MNVHRERLTGCPINVPGCRADIDTSAYLSSVNVPLNNDGWVNARIFLLAGLIKDCPHINIKKGFPSICSTLSLLPERLRIHFLVSDN